MSYFLKVNSQTPYSNSVFLENRTNYFNFKLRLSHADVETCAVETSLLFIIFIKPIKHYKYVQCTIYLIYFSSKLPTINLKFYFG